LAPNALPVIIQGGMGVAVSSWQLAREVSMAGQMGVVSGTAMDAVLARRLQDGDPEGHMRRAMAAFPVPEMAARVLDKFYIPGGKAPDAPYRPLAKLTLTSPRNVQELGVVGNFVEVWLAKEGHDGVVGINLLEKLQMATPTALLGAALAGVDYVLMGAGIPREIPQLLNAIAAGEPGRISVDVAGGTITHYVEVDPVDLLGPELPPITRPAFLAIVSAEALANYLYRDPTIRPEGFVVEGPTAGGHSAPPRGKMQLDDAGEPIYGARDMANLSKMVEIGLPFWLAGAYGTPEKVVEALAAGAAGVQVGTLFALSNDSGLTERTRAQMLEELRGGRLDVRNDPRASPTGFPFKVASLADTASDEEVYLARPRLCDLSYLRTAYEKEDGGIGYRCPAEPIDMYLKKGGTVEATEGRKCLCNGLMANIGLGQTRKDGYTEDRIVTLGQDVVGATALLAEHPEGYTARSAVEWLSAQVPAERLRQVQLVG
jgi:NAD(P)H-dependent flavin oxidoreductase YrpB (nitropropane dioxygenase family)